jgi:hypothetical protein
MVMAAMADIQLLALRGSQDIFEVFSGGRSVGLVWKDGEEWLADPYRKNGAAIREADRDAAAEKLIHSRGAG